MENAKKLFEEWREELKDKKKKLRTRNDSLDIGKIKHIGGVDISFPKTERKDEDGEDIDRVHSCVTLVVLEVEADSNQCPTKTFRVCLKVRVSTHPIDLNCCFIKPQYGLGGQWPSRIPEDHQWMKYLLNRVVYEHSSIEHMEIPYMSGYLGFREAPWYEKELEIIKCCNPELYPEVLLVDGNGIIHHEGFGSACHIGVAMDIPTIGVAKQLLYVDGLTKDDIDGSKLLKSGDSVELKGRTRGVIGKALKCTEDSTKPLFISVGHKINLDDAVDIVHRCCFYRTPGPIREADMISKKVLREDYQSHLEKCPINWREHSEKLKQLNMDFDELMHTMRQPEEKALDTN